MVIVCGEALFDVFATAESPTGMLLEARIGGSPLNVAIGLARLGVPVGFLGGVSTAFLGERLLRALHEEGVDTSLVERLDAPTTLAVVGVGAGGVPNYAFYGDGAADRRLSVQALQRLPTPVTAIHVGSFAMVVEPTASTLRALVERECRQAVISYDPNLRLNVEPDTLRWRETCDWMSTRTHLLKISEEDLASLWPGMSTEAFFARVLGAGARVAIVTRGAQGAVAATARGQVAVPAVPVQPVDTVGAGDSFQAALIACLDEMGLLSIDALSAISDDQLSRALRFASAAAALTCSRRGADLPRRAELSTHPG